MALTPEPFLPTYTPKGPRVGREEIKMRVAGKLERASHVGWRVFSILVSRVPGAGAGSCAVGWLGRGRGTRGMMMNAPRMIGELRVRGGMWPAPSGRGETAQPGARRSRGWEGPAWDCNLLQLDVLLKSVLLTFVLRRQPQNACSLPGAHNNGEAMRTSMLPLRGTRRYPDTDARRITYQWSSSVYRLNVHIREGCIGYY